MNSKILEANLFGHLQELPPYLASVQEWCVREGVTKNLMQGMVLMLDEWLTNVVMHAYQGLGGPIKVMLCWEEGCWLEACITDQGPAFDPTLMPPVDVTEDLDSRKIGGLGVHFMAQIADVFKYQRDGACNVVTLRCLQPSLDP